MKKKEFLWSMLTFVMVAMLSVGFVSCGDDDSGSDIPIVGTWVDTDDNSDVSFTFNGDGSGYLKDKSGTSNFNYAYDESSKTLKLWYVNSSLVYTYTVTLTGNTLMLSRGSSTYVLRRK